ncbi:MAG TPA: allantoin permease, partial [Chitinophagaceae bacterium]|nr:allantoin permease [Chitinophagaceae bacterium]
NWRAVVATIIGCFLACAGVQFPALKVLYDYGFFVGFGISFVIYYILMTAFPPAKVQVQLSQAK